MDKPVEVLCFDIGGTKCQWSKFINGKEARNGYFETKNSNKEEVLVRLSQIIEKNCSPTTKIGISSPTAVNIVSGECYGISGIKGYGNFNLYNELRKKLSNNWKIRAINDANAALLGTISQYSKEVNDAVLITIGTGIGGAIYIKNKIVSGKNGFAGDFGYSKTSKTTNLSEKISTSALCRRVFQKTAKKLTGKQIWNKQKTNIEIQKVLKEWTDDLLDFLFLLTVFFNPDTIFIGGGISSNKEFIYEVQSKFEVYLAKEKLSKIKPNIVQAYDGGKAGIYGAHCLWKKLKI